jgi:hypothetical protein
MIRIRSLREGFRRAGVAHSVAVTEYPDDHFTADELEQLLFEPMLAVEVLPNDVVGTAAGNDGEVGDDAGHDGTGTDADSSALATENASAEDAANPDSKKAAKK